jgi:hypothetical protein
MMNRSFRIDLMLCALTAGALVLGVSSTGSAADHGDGPVGLDVIESLLEGPLYPTAPVEVDLSYRGQPPEPVLPAGTLEFSLMSAQSGAGDDLAVEGTAVDNGDVFAEPGDEIEVNPRVYDPVSIGVYPDSSTFVVRAVLTSNENITEWELRFWRPSRPGQEFNYFEIELMPHGAGGEELGAVRLLIELQVGLGQDLVFANLGVTAPVPTGPATELRLSFDLNQNGGTVDTAEPVFKLTMLTTDAIPVPAFSPRGLIALTFLLAIVAVFAALIRALRPRKGPESPREA